MQSTRNNRQLIRTVVVIVATLAFLFGFFWLVMQITAILFYLIIAAIISILGKPICDFMESFKIGKYRIPDFLSSLITIALMYGLIFGMVLIFAPMVAEQTETISNLDTEKIAGGLQEQLQTLDEFIAHMQSGADSTISVEETISQNLRSALNVTSLTHILNNILGGLGNIIVALFSITFMTFFFLRDEQLFYRIIMTLTPDNIEPQVKSVLHSSKRYLTRYFVGLIVQSTVVFILIALGLLLLGFGNNSWLIALFAGIVNVIPYIGPIIGMLFGMLIGVSTELSMDPSFDVVPLLIKLFILFQGVQLIDNFISQPIIYSNSIKAHPLEVFIVVLIFGSLAGIPGMIAAMPLYAFFRIIAKEFFSEFKVVKKITQDID
ncbi:MAG: AI-2E family transporter [Chitinophagales bacterium]